MLPRDDIGRARGPTTECFRDGDAHLTIEAVRDLVALNGFGVVVVGRLLLLAASVSARAVGGGLAVLPRRERGCRRLGVRGGRLGGAGRRGFLTRR